MTGAWLPGEHSFVATASVNGIDICYETRGEATDPPLLMIAGLGMQLVGWGDDVLERFAREGLYVVVYDNRDIGLSTHLDGAGMPDLLSVVGHPGAEVPYRLAAMADDAAALLDHLDAAPAHVLGVSMGGMIAQELAIRHPDKVRSLVSIMSTTGAADVGQPLPEAAAQLLRASPADREAAIAMSLDISRVIGSPGFSLDAEREARMAGEAYDRSHDPAGVARQLAAVLASPDRTAGLASVAVPTLVVHGREDPLITPSGGRATADAIPGAELMMIEGVGHSIPDQLWDKIVVGVVATAGAAGQP